MLALAAAGLAPLSATARPAGFAVGLPEPDRVLREMRGSDAIDTVVCQAAALQVLNGVLMRAIVSAPGTTTSTMQGPQTSYPMTPPGSRLRSGYEQTQAQLMTGLAQAQGTGCNGRDCPLQRMGQASAQLVFRPEFQRNVLLRLTTPEWQQRFGSVDVPAPTMAAAPTPSSAPLPATSPTSVPATAATAPGVAATAASSYDRDIERHGVSTPVGPGVDATIFGTAFDRRLALPRCASDTGALRRPATDAERQQRAAQMSQRLQAPQREFCWMAASGMNSILQLFAAGNAAAFGSAMAGFNATIQLPADRCPDGMRNCTVGAQIDMTNGVLGQALIFTDPAADGEVQPMPQQK